MDDTNVIYDEVDPSGNDYVMDDIIEIQKNECYQNPAVTTTIKTPSPVESPVEKSSSSKKTAVILGLTFGTLVLLLGAVAAATAYALVEIFKIKSAISLDRGASLQQNTDITSKLESATLQMNASLQELTQELDSTIQQLQATMRVYQQVTQEISAVSSRLQQLQTSTLEALENNQNAAQQNFASISSLQQNDTALDARLDSHISSSNTAHQQLNSSITVVNSVLSQITNTCDALSSSLPAGYYYLLSSNGSAVRQYCPSITTRCGQTGRWRSVANLDMTRTNSQCPADLILHRSFSKTLCIRHSNPAGCSSVQLPTNTAYRSVCGMVRAYQFGQPEAFNGLSSIDTHYVDGVSITHGSPRQHIWSFAATYNYDRRGCPCVGGSDVRPSFVGNDYFCDSGSYNGSGLVFYGDNPLWDGAGCDGSANTCCSFNTPPWFYKELSQYTHDTIELRICSDQNRNNEDTFLEAFAIYAK